MRREFDGQAGLGHDLVAHKVSQGHFTGGDQIQGSVFGLRAPFLPALVGGKQISLKLGQLAGALKALGVDHIGRVALRIAVLLSLHLKHELRQGPVQAGNGAFHHRKTRAAELGAGVKVQPQRLAQIHMVARHETQSGWNAPRAHHHIGVFILTHRHGGMRHIGHRQQQLMELVLQGFQTGGRLIQLCLKLAHLGHSRFCLFMFALAFEHAHLLAQSVAPCL